MLAEEADRIAAELRKQGHKKEAKKVQHIKNAAAKAKTGAAMELAAKDGHAMAAKLQKLELEEQGDAMAQLADKLDAAAQEGQEHDGKKKKTKTQKKTKTKVKK